MYKIYLVLRIIVQLYYFRVFHLKNSVPKFPLKSCCIKFLLDYKPFQLEFLQLWALPLSENLAIAETIYRSYIQVMYLIGKILDIIYSLYKIFITYWISFLDMFISWFIFRSSIMLCRTRVIHKIVHTRSSSTSSFARVTQLFQPSSFNAKLSPSKENSSKVSYTY